MQDPKPRPWTEAEKEKVDLHLSTPMGAPVPSISQIRSAIQYLENRHGIDGKAAYERWAAVRPKGWARLPSYEVMMADTPRSSQENLDITITICRMTSEGEWVCRTLGKE